MGPLAGKEAGEGLEGEEAERAIYNTRVKIAERTLDFVRDAVRKCRKGHVGIHLNELLPDNALGKGLRGVQDISAADILIPVHIDELMSRYHRLNKVRGLIDHYKEIILEVARPFGYTGLIEYPPTGDIHGEIADDHPAALVTRA